MYKHLLVATDGSELAGKAVRHGIALAKHMGAAVTALTVRPHLDDFVAEGVAITVSAAEREAFKRHMEHNLDLARKEAAEHGMTIETVQVESGEPWRAIIETADAKKCDLIVMASHGRRGLSALILGSQTQKVLTHTHIPVLVYK